MQRTLSKIAIETLLAKLNGINPNLTPLVEALLRVPAEPETNRKNIFETPTATDFDRLKAWTDGGVNIPEKLIWTVRKSSLPGHNVMPIRAFRAELTRVWSAVDKLRIFLSSGTTSGPEGRSRSAFSPKGALLYQAASIATFFDVLETLIPPFSGDFLSTRILSLIPPVDEWSDSSLAQMVGWFSEVWPVEYVNAESPDHLRSHLNATTTPRRLVVIFGTAFHFVNLLDQGPRFDLPEGSIIVETGGTKGKSRSITRPELYARLVSAFGIKPENIVSEYGMCELACQAWDTVSDSVNVTLSERRFRFPWWVQSGIMATSSEIASQGVGALTINDPLRVDLPHLAIQTEDLAMVRTDGSFQLLGRVPRAPLKGCSLRVDSISVTMPVTATDTKTHHLKTRSKETGAIVACDAVTFSRRAPAVRQWLLELLSDRDATARLGRELGDAGSTGQTICDLMSGLPGDVGGFVSAALNASTNRSLPKSWLIIPPASHSIAAIQPLAAAFTVGLKLRVRLPSIHGLDPNQTFFARALDLASAHGLEIEILPNSWRLGVGDLVDGERILVFGDDETLSWFENFAPGRVAGFGNAVSVSFTSGREMANSDHVHLIIKDALNLMQRGCLSSRAVISIGGDPATLVSQLMSEMSPNLCRRPLTVGETCARSMEFVRLSQAGFHLAAESSAVTVAAKNSSVDMFAKDVMAAFSHLDLVIGVICLPEETPLQPLINELCRLVPLRVVAASESTRTLLTKSEMTGNFPNNFGVVRSGTLGAPRFDGYHLGQPFFAVRPSSQLK
jgi:hypothetical protein